MSAVHTYECFPSTWWTPKLKTASTGLHVPPALPPSPTPRLLLWNHLKHKKKQKTKIVCMGTRPKTRTQGSVLLGRAILLGGGRNQSIRSIHKSKERRYVDNDKERLLPSPLLSPPPHPTPPNQPMNKKYARVCWRFTINIVIFF